MTHHLKLTILLLTALFTGCTHNSEPCSRDIILARLQEAANTKTALFGHQDDLCYGHSWNEDPGRSDIKDLCGDYPAVVGFDLGGIELGNNANLDGVSFDLMRARAEEHSRRGGIITFSWHPRNPYTKGDAWDVSSDQVVASILEGGECHSEFMTWLKRAADFLESVKDADGQPVAAIFRPWHENTGSWFWWGEGLCTKEEYQALWDLTYDYMVKQRGLNNLIWAYSPGGGADRNKYMERYPGDGIIDILGLDAYQYAGSALYQTLLRASFDFMEGLATEHGKLLALTEFGYEGIPEADWWTATLAPVIQEYHISYMLAWRNAHDKPSHFYVPFAGSVSADDFKAFHDNCPSSFVK